MTLNTDLSLLWLQKTSFVLSLTFPFNVHAVKILYHSDIFITHSVIQVRGDALDKLRTVHQQIEGVFAKHS